MQSASPLALLSVKFGMAAVGGCVLVASPATAAVPVAANDSYATSEDSALTVSAAQGVLANDTDSDGNSLASGLVQGPSNGTVTVNADGSLTYVPNANFSGTDRFTYGVTDVRYRIVPLGTLAGNNSFALDVSNNRQVTGNSSATAGASTPLQAYLWQNGTMTGLGALAGTGSNNFSRGYAVNDFGVVVGESDNDASKAFVYRNGAMSGLPRLAGGSFNGVASDINNGGAIVGSSSNGTAIRPTLWTLINGSYSPADLGTIAGTPNSSGRAWAINDAGVAAGLSLNASSTSQATRWSGGTVTNLGSLGDGKRFSQAFGLNGNGQVVGSSLTGQTVGQLIGGTSSTGITRAFTWQDGAIRELRPHNFYAPGNTGATTNYHSEAKDVNNAGLVVGNSQRIASSPATATAWDNGAPMDLNALVPTGSGWVLRSAEGINQGGDIAGYGFFGGANRAFLLVPEVTSPNGRIFSATATVTVTVNGTPDAPVAADDTYRTEAGDVVRGNVLFNDNDPDGDALVATLATGPGKGSLALNPNGTFTYTPGSSFDGSDSFTYSVSDGNGGTDTATVSILLATIPSFAATLSQGHVDIGIFAGSEDTVIDHGNHTHVIEGDFGWDLHVHDEEDDKEYHPDEALLRVRSQALGERPSGSQFDFIGVGAGEPIWRLPQTQNPDLLYLGIGAEEIEAGTFQRGQIRLRLKAVNGPGQFSLWQSGDSGPSVAMATADGITDADSTTAREGSHSHYNYAFTAAGRYEVTFEASGTLPDGTTTSSGDVTYYFDVDAAPTISDIADQSTAEDTPTEPLAFTIADGKTAAGALSVTATSSDTALVPNSSIVLGGSGASRTVTITPAANGSGTATITLTVTNAAGLSATDSFVLQVLAVDDAPINSVPGAQTTAEDTALTFSGAGRTLSVSDADSEALTLTLSVTNGTLSLSRIAGLAFTAGDGTADATMTFRGTAASINAALDGLSFAPATDFNGSATLTLKSSDGTVANDATSTVAIAVTPVNDAPVALSQALAATTTAPLALTLTATDIDSPQSGLTFSVLTQPANGTLSGSGASLRYTARRGFSGTNSFTFRANDGSLSSNVATVTLRVSDTNAAPVARDDAARTAFNVPVAVQVLANDTDADGDTLSVTSVSASGTRGTLRISDDRRSVLFTPEAGFSGTTSFGYTVSDGVATASARATITVDAQPEPPAPVNRAPVAVADSYASNGPLQVLAAQGVLQNDTDADGQPLTATLKSTPAHGTLRFSADGSFLYTPAVGYAGRDAFTYAAFDGKEESAPATVALQVAATRDATPPTVELAGGALRTVRALAPARGSAADVYAVRGQGIVVSSGLRSVTVRLQRGDGQYWNGRAYQRAPFELPATVDGRAFFVASTSLPPSLEGRYRWSATATDNAGNRAVAQQTVIVDTTTPRLVISTPAAGADGVARLAQLDAVSGRVSEAASISIVLRNAQGQSFNGTSFGAPAASLPATRSGSAWTLDLPADLTLAPGRYTLEVRATDAAGNTGRATRTLEVASAPTR